MLGNVMNDTAAGPHILTVPHAVVPLCYFIDDPVELYVMFKELYSRYFHKLHVISDDPQVWRFLEYTP